MIAEDDLDGRLKDDNPFVWLGTRFIDSAARRADVVLLYAFQQELRRITDTVENPMIAAIRYAWWREHLERAASPAGALPTGHPVADPVAKGVVRGIFDFVLLDRIIDDEAGELPPAGYTPPLLGSAARVLDPAVELGLLTPIATAWSLGCRLRSAAVERQVEAREGLSASPTRLAAEIAFAEVWPEAQAASRDLPKSVFPAVCHVTLAPHWARGGSDNTVLDRVRLVQAVARGCL